ncbi:MAG TPA: S9 family peptidase, partial [Thermomicrobiaceae bacterium]|nr:S9 family peptidase [Thermomicrobiaceae bacterium]
GGEPRQLSAGPWTDDLPRWSPDGAMLAFRSDRAERGRGQLYLLRGTLAEAEPLHAFPAGIGAIHWSPDGRTIAVVAADPPAREAQGRDEARDWFLFEDEPRYERIWLVDVATGDVRRLTDRDLQVWELDWSPDGRQIAALVSDLPYPWAWYRARLVAVDVASGAARTLYAPSRQLARPAWSPDGRGVALITSTWSDPGMTGGDVVLVPADGGEPRDLTPGQPRSHLDPHWLPGGETLVTAALERNRAAVCAVGLDGETETLWSDERAFAGQELSLSRDGTVLVAAIGEPSRPAELWVGRRGPGAGASVAWERRTDFNPAFAERRVAPTETVAWTAADGTPVEGLLVRPLEPVAGPVPMVVLIHGGPTASSDYGFRGTGPRGWVQLLAARGCAVLMPNPRGSAGWGLAFAEANHGDMGGQDLADILAGVDHCVAAGIADPGRLGVGGWSYGGYLTAWAVTQTDRFKAAIAGASITDWYSFHGGTNIPAFDEVFYRSDPYALDGPYATRSPLFYVDRVSTPTLFLHGEQDPCCPVGQAYEMHRALRARGVESRCVVYPRQPHPIREREHVRDLLERGVAWFGDRLLDRSGA